MGRTAVVDHRRQLEAQALSKRRSGLEEDIMLVECRMNDLLLHRPVLVLDI